MGGIALYGLIAKTKPLVDHMGSDEVADKSLDQLKPKILMVDLL